jgi:hypothetical protein
MFLKNVPPLISWSLAVLVGVFLWGCRGLRNAAYKEGRPVLNVEQTVVLGGDNSQVRTNKVVFHLEDDAPGVEEGK